MEQMKEFCFETVLSTERNLKLLVKAADKGYFIRCYYILTADPMINVWRVKARVASGGHDVPEEKIISRYDRALALVKNLVPICDIFHIYDNSSSSPVRIFKKRKDEVYFSECEDWRFEDIRALTGVSDMVKAELNQTNVTGQ